MGFISIVTSRPTMLKRATRLISCACLKIISRLFFFPKKSARILWRSLEKGKAARLKRQFPRNPKTKKRKRPRKKKRRCLKKTLSNGLKFRKRLKSKKSRNGLRNLVLKSRITKAARAKALK